MPVTPVVNMPHKEGRRHPERAHLVKLVRPRGLTVLDAMPRVMAGMPPLRFRKREEDVVDRGITVAMNSHLIPAAMILCHKLHERIPRARRVAAVTLLP